MSIGRREFFRLACTAAAGLAAGEVTASERADNGGRNGDSLGVLVDASVCISCRKCEWACNRQHQLTDRPQADFEDRSVCLTPRRPDASAFTVVNRYPEETPGRGRGQGPVPALPAPGVRVGLPGRRAAKHPQGPVTYDARQCIGCRYCMVACPFEIPAYEYRPGADAAGAQVHLLLRARDRRGAPPACVEICPNEALTFGRREDLIDAAYIRMKTTPDRYLPHLYGEHEVGGTSWLYLAAGGLWATPVCRRSPTGRAPDATERIQHGVFKGFVPPLALYGLLGLVMLHPARRSGADATTTETEGER